MSTARRFEPALAGCTIVIAADRRAGDLANALERRGARVYRAPALSIQPIVDDDELLQRTRDLIAHPPDLVVVTTGVGFRGWMDAAHENGLADEFTAALAQTVFVARGPKAHGAIQQAGFDADWVADSETAAEVGEYLRTLPLTDKRVAVQFHGAGADGLDALLASAGADVVPVTVYRWGPPPDPTVVDRSVRQAASGEVDAVVFTSAPGASAWVRTADRLGALPALRDRTARGRLMLASVGPVTTSPLTEAGLTPTQAERARLGSLARCVIAYFTEGGGAPSLRTPDGVLALRSGGAVIAGDFFPLSRTATSALSALFDGGGRVLTRDEIAAAAPRAGRNAHAVEMAVARLREALRGFEIVQTVVKRGYRLAVEEHV